ncbi:MAG TPA: NUDIX hydrolase [Rhodoblastus sp.]|nr:NUDIX hydrolase [Rhodoblastus sp.]
MSDLPRIFRVARIDARVSPFDWDFARERASDIAAHWTEAVAKKPAMFDGRVLLGHALDYAPQNGGQLRSRYFETAFSAFLAYRDFDFPGGRVFNGFAMAALRTADGAFLLGEMGAHTANAGISYFPAGTPDRDDVVGDEVDLTGSVLRELQEETGVALAREDLAPDWTIVRLDGRVACMKPVQLDGNAQELARAMDAFLAREKEPELAGMRIVRSMNDLDRLRVPEFTRLYLAHEFGADDTD